MAVKTFVPQITRILHHACNYISKHHTTLATYLSSGQLALLDAVVVACNAYTSSVVVPPDEP